MAGLCDETTLQSVIQAMQTHPDQLDRVDALIAAHPEDARLHFLRGSMLASGSRPIDAHRALSRAVEIAPDFAIARFQLGLFQLTSGETTNALDTFGRLDGLPDSHYLRKFVEGLRSLIRDDFPGAIENLRQGILMNDENAPLSRDMQMVIDRCLAVAGSDAREAPISETSLILSQFSSRRSVN